MTLRRAAVAVCVLSLACGVPGIRPEGRDVTIGLTSEASPADIHDLAVGWLTRRGYAIRADGTDRVQADKPLGPTDTGDNTRTSFLDIEIDSSGAASRVEVHGHTAIVSGAGHRVAVDIASSTRRDAEELATAISRMAAPR